MKLIKPIIALTASALLLAGCASPDADDETTAASAENQSPVESPDTESPTTETPTEEESSPSPSATASPTAKPSPLPTTKDEVDAILGSEPPTYSERGTLPKKIGQPGAKGEENGVVFMSFRVSDIDTDVTCQSSSNKPENGRFVAVHMDFQTTKAMADAGWTELSPYDWEFLQEDGTMFNGSVFTEAALTCLPDAETLPENIGPARKASGKVVLDVTEDPGFIVFGRQEIDNNGWEYTLPK